MIGVSILGATGSIGLSTLDVLSRHNDRYRIVALTANSQVERMRDLCLTHRPAYAVMADADAAEKLAASLATEGCDTEILSGVDGLNRVASLDEVDYVMAAIVGAAGLPPTLAAARSGKRVLLANKEALVMSGKLFMQEVAENGAELLPIDSEHNAIFQCMPVDFDKGLDQVGVERILLTASGGPFRETPLEQLASVTPEQAVAHPNWSMGRKISVDSATMMNKGLEVIEACWLFNTDTSKIKVVLHPQSVIHSMVQYSDGSVLAQLGNPDMRTPIAHALSWPERMSSGVEELDIFKVARLDFTEADLQRFPCLRLAFEAIEAGGTYSATLNAANEVAVDAFLNERIGFTEIARVIEESLSQAHSYDSNVLDDVFRADGEARRLANSIIDKSTV